ESGRGWYLTARRVPERGARMVTAEWMSPGRHSVEEGAHREDVRAPIHLRAAQLLRSHVGELAVHFASPRERGGRRGRLRDPEIDDFHGAREAHEHVLR